MHCKSRRIGPPVNAGGPVFSIERKTKSTAGHTGPALQNQIIQCRGDHAARRLSTAVPSRRREGTPPYAIARAAVQIRRADRGGRPYKPFRRGGVLPRPREGKSAKRRQWRMKRAGFEEVPRLAGTTVPVSRLARRWAREPLPYAPQDTLP